MARKTQSQRSYSAPDAHSYNDNIVDMTYLHSKSINFTNYATKIDIGGMRTSKEDAPYQDAIKFFSDRLTEARETEKSFYKDSEKFYKEKYGEDIIITNQYDWADYFLERPDSKNLDEKSAQAQNIETVINSTEGRKILYSGRELSWEESREKLQDFLNQFSDSLLKKYSLKLGQNEGVSQFFTRVFKINSKAKDFTSSHLSKTEYQKALIEVLGFQEVFGYNSKEEFEQAEDFGPMRKKGGKLNRIINEFYKEDNSVRLNRLKDYIRQQIPDVDQILLDQYMNQLKQELNIWTKGQDAPKGGFILESALTLTFQIEFGEDKVERWSNVKKPRFNRNPVDPKTDILLKLGKEGGYRLQLKNTETDAGKILENLLTGKSINNLNSFVNMKLHGFGQKGMSYLDFKRDTEMIKGLNIQPDTYSKLEYILVNYNVLSQRWKSLENVRANKGKSINEGVPYFKLTEDIISKTLENFLILFISDFIEKTGEGFKAEPYDFIVYAGKALIPMSLIYEKIIIHLQDKMQEQKGELARVKMATKLNTSIFSAGDFTNMVNDKRLYRSNNTTPNEWYSDMGYVKYGMVYGQKALKAITLQDPHLHIDLFEIMSDEELDKLSHNLVAASL